MIARLSKELAGFMLFVEKILNTNKDKVSLIYDLRLHIADLKTDGVKI